MSISYDPLWHLLIEKKMKKGDLRTLTGMSQSTLAKLGKNEPVTLDILEKITMALDCRVEDILEFVKNEQ